MLTDVDMVNSTIVLKDKQSVVKLLLYIKFFEKGIKLTSNEISIVALIVDNESKKEVIDEAIRLKYVKSVQSGENFISKLVRLGVISKISPGKRKVGSEYLAETKAPYLAVNLKLYNATNQSKKPS